MYGVGHKQPPSQPSRSPNRPSAHARAGKRYKNGDVRMICILGVLWSSRPIAMPTVNGDQPARENESGPKLGKPSALYGIIGAAIWACRAGMLPLLNRPREGGLSWIISRLAVS